MCCALHYYVSIVPLIDRKRLLILILFLFLLFDMGKFFVMQKYIDLNMHVILYIIFVAFRLKLNYR